MCVCVCPCACVRVAGINKTTNVATLTYDPWGGARLDDAVGELERQGGRVVADCEGIRADEPTETHTGVAY